MKFSSLMGLVLLALVTTRGEDRVSLMALSGTGVGEPYRIGGEVSLETDRFYFKHLTLGYLGLLPISRERDRFDIFPGIHGFDGYFLGLRHRFQQAPIAPFVGVNVLGHFLSEEPYISVNPEIGISIRCLKGYELSAQLQYFVTSYGRSEDFLLVGFALTHLF